VRLAGKKSIDGRIQRVSVLEVSVIEREV